MLDEKDEEMILKFIQRNYPVARIKHNMRFRRAIVIDGKNPHILSDANSTLPIKIELGNIIKKIFDCNYITAEKLITKALNI